MYRDILRKVNFAFYVLLVLFIVAIQSTVFSYFPLYFVQPDLVLILTVYLGFKRNLFEGALLVFLSALILETASGAGNNFFVTSYLYTFIIAKILSKTIVSPSFVSTVLIAAALSLFKRVAILVLLGMRGKVDNAWMNFFIYIIPHLVVQGLFTPVCFEFFRFLDTLTYKDEHAEDEYDLNRGGSF